MRLSSLCAGVLAALLVAPSVAGADVFGVYQDLSQRRLTPAPLVFTEAAPPLGALDHTMFARGSRRRSGYGLRLEHGGRHGPDAVIAFSGGDWKTIAAALREQRRAGFKVVRTRIRGHRGYALSRRLGGLERDLLWSEGGRVYWMGSATPKTVSARELRLGAAHLQPLGGVFAGGPDPTTEPGAETGAVAITTTHTISIDASWGADCIGPGGAPNNYYGGGAHAALIPLDGSAFSVDTARYASGSATWSGTVSGTVAPGSVSVTVSATGTFDGNACTAGPITFTLIPIPIR